MKATLHTSIGEMQRGTRRLPCPMCGALITCEVATTLNPEAPEMLRPAPEAWIEMVQTYDGATNWIACCSDRCLRTLLSH
jgi:hypothetical protein